MWKLISLSPSLIHKLNSYYFKEPVDVTGDRVAIDSFGKWELRNEEEMRPFVCMVEKGERYLHPNIDRTNPILAIGWLS